MTGLIVSETQVAVREVLAVLPQPSVIVHVLVWIRVQPLLIKVPSVPVVAVGVNGPQLSVKVAEPNAAPMVARSGLQAAITPFGGVPVVVITGTVTSDVHVAVREALDVLPHPSVTFHVLV